MGIPSAAEKFQGEQCAKCMGRRNLGGSREVSAIGNLGEGYLCQVSHEEEQTPEFRAERAWTEVQGAHIDRISFLDGRPSGALIIAATRQAGEALLRKNLGNGDSAEPRSLFGEAALYIVNREVLFAQGYHLGANRVSLGCSLRTFAGWKEELAVGVAPEVVTEDTEGTGRITEASSRKCGGPAVDKKGTKRLVLAMSGVGWFKKGALVWCYLFSFFD